MEQVLPRDGAAAYARWTNLAEMFFETVSANPEKPLGWGKRKGTWVATTRQAAAEQVDHLARGLLGLGVQPGDRLILVAENRPEFLIADLAIMTIGAITVPAYTTNTAADHRHILEDSGAVAAIVSTGALAKRLLPAADEAPDCRMVISIDGFPPETQVRDLDLQLWSDVLTIGQNRSGPRAAEMAAQIRRDQTCCFIYTSGTGGAPKGVMLTHGNLLANCRSAFSLLEPVGLGEEVFLSFLPLSHSYEHTAGQFFPLSIGAEIYYSSGIEHLSQELVEVRPTIMTAVPRLYEALHQRIRRGVAKQKPFQRKLFEQALALGIKRYHDPKSLGLVERIQNSVLEKLVRDKVRGRFGGRLRGMVSGGAALDPEIGLFFTALGLCILQGYGQTEASPVVACNPPDRVKLHTVGPALAGVEVKIAEDGEILVRGENVMKGYWNMPEATAEALEDGWLHTGDIGRFDAEGYLQITDRKKDIIVLSGGDNVSPARIEGRLTLNPEIAQAMVYGDKRPHLVALIIPDDDFLRAWAKEKGKSGDLRDLAGDRDLKQALDPVIARVNADLATVEKIRRFTLVSEPFTVENAMMTPTLKVRRHKVRDAYRPVLESLY